jgi:uncharacterized protein DUF1566
MKVLRCGICATLASLFIVSTASAQVMSWATQIGNNRFKVLSQFNNEAVLDLETGLVWERQPDTTTTTWNVSTLATAHVLCNIKAVGKRLGWRLPSVQEIASLFDASHAAPQLPTGHPFVLTADQLAGSFWTSTVDTTFGEPGQVWIAQMFAPDLQETVVVGGMDQPRYNWCVRTGSGTDVQ